MHWNLELNLGKKKKPNLEEMSLTVNGIGSLSKIVWLGSCQHLSEKENFWR